MFYIYTILIPLIVGLILYFVYKPNKTKKYLNFFIYLIIILFVYAFLMYFLEMEKIVTAGWVFYSLIFFLVPSFIIVLILKLIFFFFIKNKNK